MRSKDPGVRNYMRRAFWREQRSGARGWEGSCRHGGRAGFPAPGKVTDIMTSLPLKLDECWPLLDTCWHGLVPSTWQGRAVPSITLGVASAQGTAAADIGASPANVRSTNSFVYM